MSLLVVASSQNELHGATEVDTAVVGVGLVQAAIGTLRAIDLYKPDVVLCFGIAGASDPQLVIGDVVSASSVLQYDMDLRPFGLKRGETYGSNGIVGALEVLPLKGFETGVIGSADRFCLASWRAENPWLTQELGVRMTDMESYAMASACKERGVPCHVVRVVSDTCDGRRPKKFGAFMKDTVSQVLAECIRLSQVKSPR